MKQFSVQEDFNVRTLVSLLMVLLVGVFLASPQAALAGDKDKDKKDKEVFNAFITPTGGGAAMGKALPITITITGWTTDAEKEQYANILKTEGQNALLKAIKKNNLGFSQIGSNVGQTILAARSQTAPDGSRKITAIWLSVTGTFEVRAASNAKDFPFAYVEMIKGADGKWNGMMAAAVGVTVKPDGSLDLENFGAYPGKLMSLDEQK
jgi:hypothetical protein